MTNISEHPNEAKPRGAGVDSVETNSTERGLKEALSPTAEAPCHVNDSGSAMTTMRSKRNYEQAGSEPAMATPGAESSVVDESEQTFYKGKIFDSLRVVDSKNVHLTGNHSHCDHHGLE